MTLPLFGIKTALLLTKIGNALVLSKIVMAMINGELGNWGIGRPIRSTIILVIKQIGLLLRGRLIWLTLLRLQTDWTPLNPVAIMNSYIRVPWTNLCHQNLFAIVGEASTRTYSLQSTITPSNINLCVESIKGSHFLFVCYISAGQTKLRCLRPSPEINSHSESP